MAPVVKHGRSRPRVNYLIATGWRRVRAHTKCHEIRPRESVGELPPPPPFRSPSSTIEAHYALLDPTSLISLSLSTYAAGENA